METNKSPLIGYNSLNNECSGSHNVAFGDKNTTYGLNAMNDLTIGSNSGPFGLGCIEPDIIKINDNKGAEIIKINQEGFFYKGKLIAEDHDIYLSFKEFLGNTNLALKPVKLNAIEEYQNLVELLKQALKFYGNNVNYHKTSPDDNTVLIQKDHGYQARFALDKIDEAQKSSEKTLADYEAELKDFESGETYKKMKSISDILNNNRNDSNI